MAKKKGASHLAVLQRREHVKSLLLRGFSEREICGVLGVSEDTVTRDVRAVLDDWKQAIKIQDLYSVRQAFDFLNELMRQFWVIFHRAPREFVRRDGLVVEEDRSRIQLQCLDSLVEVVRELNQMAGIGTPRMFERLRCLESERARGFEGTGISVEGRMKRGVERRRSDIGKQRREGTIRDGKPPTP